jgi:hypothetical protein
MRRPGLLRGSGKLPISTLQERCQKETGYEKEYHYEEEPEKAEAKERSQIRRMAAKQKLTIGIDLGDQSSRYCIFADGQDPVSEGQLPTTKAGLDSLFAKMSQPNRGGGGDAFAVGKSALEIAGA